MSIPKSYVRNLTQKYRLAVAIAVLKEKPDDVSIDTYVQELKTSINGDEIDLDITLCSEDFEIEDNDNDKAFNDIRNNDSTISITEHDKIANDKFFTEYSDSNVGNINRTSHINDTTSDKHFDDNDKVFDGIIEQQYTSELEESQSIIAQNHMITSKFFEPRDIPKLIKPTPNVPQKELFLNDACENRVPETYYDSQETELYTVPSYTQNFTHISQSQRECGLIVLNNKFLRTKSNEVDTNIAINLDPTSKNNGISNLGGNNTNLSIEDISNSNIRYNIDGYTESNHMASMKRQDSMYIMHFPQCAQDYNNLQTNGTIEEIDCIENVLNTEEILNTEIDREINEDEPIVSEIVSFKVIEELNTVKKYINRKIERRVSNGSDSGYSDNLRSSFRSSLQASTDWLNQSAHSLYEYITQCPLLNSTQEIVNEISQVLGQLIDKLHTEEKYPTFLEEILDYVKVLLQDVMKAVDKHALLTKEEIIHRLLLLNKSMHIQKYTIEQITISLEKIHTDLTKLNTTYEISNTHEMENLPYLFHILEVILKNYIKVKDTTSQEISNSQNELKRSSLSDIWRRKWNPNFEECSGAENVVPKKCVISKCNEVLNKMVVDCMAGYSLVAFLALQCFNLLQP